MFHGSTPLTMTGQSERSRKLSRTIILFKYSRDTLNSNDFKKSGDTTTNERRIVNEKFVVGWEYLFFGLRSLRLSLSRLLFGLNDLFQLGNFFLKGLDLFRDGRRFFHARTRQGIRSLP
jgi:hypothetical protein